MVSPSVFNPVESALNAESHGSGARVSGPDASSTSVSAPVAQEPCEDVGV